MATKPRTKPESPWAAQHRTTVRRLLELREEVRAARLQMDKLLSALPDGRYFTQGERVRLSTATRYAISIRELRRFVTDDVLRRCRRSAVRRVLIVEPMEP